MSTTATHQNIQLQTADGISLVATHFAPAQESSQWIVVASATAVPRGFYRRFGLYAAERGVHVLTTDYRGIGDSTSMLPVRDGKPTLKGFEMQYADWSRYDLAAAVDYARQRGRVWVVGHSLGGHALGQLPNHDAIQAAYVCGVGAGWHGWMPGIERFKVQLMWNVVGPICSRLYGYHPMSKFGMGEDLPMGVYRDWKRWCALPHYFFDDPAPDARVIVEQFKAVRLPVAASVSVDDLWAPPSSRDAFFKGYVNAPVTPIDLQPKQLGVQSIGHMGYFRAQVGEKLWPQILQWLGQHGLQSKPA